MGSGIVPCCDAYEVSSDCIAAQTWHEVTRRCCRNIKLAMKPHPSRPHPHLLTKPCYSSIVSQNHRTVRSSFLSLPHIPPVIVFILSLALVYNNMEFPTIEKMPSSRTDGRDRDRAQHLYFGTPDVLWKQVSCLKPCIIRMEDLLRFIRLGFFDLQPGFDDDLKVLKNNGLGGWIGYFANAEDTA